MNSDHVTALRPGAILRAFDALDGERMFVSTIPSAQIGSTTMLEKLMLVALMRIFAARDIFEFGTFKGETTFTLLKNAPHDARVHSMDLPYSPEDLDGKQFDLRDGDENDAFLRLERQGKFLAEFSSISADEKARLTLLEEDSLAWDHAAYENSFDFVFVDGGHSTELIASDTAKANAIARQDSLILWHDFGSKVHLDVSTFLDGYAKGCELFTIGDTSLAFQLNGDFRSKAQELGMLETS